MLLTVTEMCSGSTLKHQTRSLIFVALQKANCETYCAQQELHLLQRREAVTKLLPNTHAGPPILPVLWVNTDFGLKMMNFAEL